MTRVKRCHGVLLDAIRNGIDKNHTFAARFLLTGPAEASQALEVTEVEIAHLVGGTLGRRR